MSTRIVRRLALAAAIPALACRGSDSSAPDLPVDQAPVTYSATGDIVPQLQAFRTALGEPFNAGLAGEQATGRRDIGWDGGIANPLNNRDDFPGTYFNSTVNAGVIFTTPGTGFRIDSLLFAGVNPGYANEFHAYTPDRLFSPIGSNVMEVLFRVAGESTPAVVSGFGAVFSDVDLANQTAIEYFDANGARLLQLHAPPRSDADGNSFIGATFAGAVVARVRITVGSGALGAANADVSAGGQADVVVADNFVYGEPRAIR